MKKIRYGAEAALVYLLFFLFRLLPLDAASGLGGLIGRSLGPHLAASRKARRNLVAAFPEMSDKEQTAIIAGMWDNLGRVIAEYPHLETIARKRTETTTPEHLAALLDSNEARIIISGHFANWEVPGAALYLQHGIKPHLTYRAPNNPWTARLLHSCRTLGGTLPAIPKSRASAQILIRAMRDKQVTGILIDQKYNEGLAVPFFGRPAMTNPVFAQLGQKFAARVIPMHIMRLKGANFRIALYDDLRLTDENGAPRPALDIMAEAHRHLEDWIRQNPAQWLWLHRRWPEQDMKGDTI